MSGDGEVSLLYTMAVWQEMIHKMGKECFDTELNMGQEYQKGRVEEMHYVGSTQKKYLQ